nr:FixH family protein [Deltaproteobacteria bacterium]
KAGVAGALDFKLMTANPAPPARGDNIWTLQVSAMAGGTVGAPVAGGMLTVTPFMPDHQHGTPLRVEITDQGNGMYELSPVNMWMPGLWETTIQVSSASGTDQAIYRFCIPN